MVLGLRGRYGAHPERMVEELIQICDGGVEFVQVSRLVRKHYLFGPWIAWKIGDMLERIFRCPITFDNVSAFMFKDPVEGALMVWRQHLGLPKIARPTNQLLVLDEVVEYLRTEFSDLAAPPWRDRPITILEVETSICKFKSHINGHYPLNNDIDEINAGLSGWGKTAQAFGEAMPKSMRLEECLKK